MLGLGRTLIDVFPAVEHWVTPGPGLVHIWWVIAVGADTVAAIAAGAESTPAIAPAANSGAAKRILNHMLFTFSYFVSGRLPRHPR
jgi:hypothetical protein